MSYTKKKKFTNKLLDKLISSPSINKRAQVEKEKRGGEGGKKGSAYMICNSPVCNLLDLTYMHVLALLLSFSMRNPRYRGQKQNRLNKQHNRLICTTGPFKPAHMCG